MSDATNKPRPAKPTAGVWTFDGQCIRSSARVFPLAEVPGCSADTSRVDAANGSLMAAAPDLFAALDGMVRMFAAVAAKVEWGRTALDADAIRQMNEAPIAAAVAMEKAKGRAVAAALATPPAETPT